MYKFALIGRDIGYTRSPKIHAAIADALGFELSFEVCDVTYDLLENTVCNLLDRCDGFFVTKPYKTAVGKLLGADISVNVVRSRDRKCFDTDGDGFVLALDRNFSDWKNRVDGVLILGAGGAAHAVASAMCRNGKQVYVLNRSLMNAVRFTETCAGSQLYTGQSAQMIVNCTPVGQNGEDVLRAMCVMPQFDYAFDLIYTEDRTPFLRRCAAAGAETQNGADMLMFQAIKGDMLLTDTQCEIRRVFDAVQKTVDGSNNG